MTQRASTGRYASDRIKEGEEIVMTAEHDQFLMEIRPLLPEGYNEAAKSGNDSNPHHSCPDIRLGVEEERVEKRRYRSAHRLSVDLVISKLAQDYSATLDDLILTLLNQERVDLGAMIGKLGGILDRARGDIGRIVEARGVGRVRSEIMKSEHMRQWVEVLRVIKELSLAYCKAKREISDDRGTVASKSLSDMFSKVNRLVNRDIKYLSFGNILTNQDREEIFEQIMQIVRIDMPSPTVKKHSPRHKNSSRFSLQPCLLKKT